MARYDWQDDADPTQPDHLCPDDIDPVDPEPYFPYPIPELRVEVRWNVLDEVTNDPKDLTGAFVASDSPFSMGQGHGITAHADLMYGWDDEVFAELVDVCIQGLPK